MRVLSLDPGERVGWATGYVLGVTDGTHRLDVVAHGMLYLKEAAADFCARIMNHEYDVVVIERWNLTAKGARVLVGSDMPWSQFYGMIRKACWDSGTTFEPQWPADMRTARRWLKTDHPSAADVAERVANADAVHHDEGHDGSALLHLWFYFFERYV